jgi:glucose-1-phosphate adenylyltransferase
MLLAGGQGSRLGVLTKDIAKPAVPFGGKYKIIDFALSNCINSGIETVGVLTQYQPLELSDHIGSGKPWDLDRLLKGVHILPPFQSTEGAMWYKGTANAIYQNIAFIERYSPEYVLILSGDHIYKMDYSQMLSFHKEKGADCTISVLEVPMEEACRFGIMNVNNDGTIYEFEEKPKVPKNNLASMGIYIFSWSALKEYLIKDEMDKTSSNDFGKNLIPAMLEDGKKLCAYRFDGYWKDVGTIDSLWEANMDLLAPTDPLKLNDQNWRIYSETPMSAPQYIGENAKIENSIITEGCDVLGNVSFSLLFEGVTVEEGAEITGSIIMPGTKIKKNAAVRYCIVGENSTVEEGVVLGQCPPMGSEEKKWGITVIAPNSNLKNSVINFKNMC